MQSNVVSNVVLTGLTIHCHLLAITSGGPGTVENVSVSNIVVERSAMPFLFARSTAVKGVRRNWVFDNVTLAEPAMSTGPAMTFGNCENMTLTRSVVPIGKYDSHLALSIESCTGNVYILDNDFLPGGNRTYEIVDPQPGLNVTAVGNKPAT